MSAAPDSIAGLSIIIAASESAAAVSRCLASLFSCDRSGEVEVLVAYREDRVRPVEFDRRVIWIRCRPRSDVHELRYQGFLKSRSDRLVFTEDSSQFSSSWLAMWLTAFSSRTVDAGTGHVELGSIKTIVNLGVFFCEYAPFLSPETTGPPRRLAGNNFAVRRAPLIAILGDNRAIRESDVAQALRDLHGCLVHVRGAGITHERTYALTEAIHDRLRFGYEFGITCASSWSVTTRTVKIALGPLALASQVGRLAITLLRKRRLGGELLDAGLVAILLLSAWSVAEWLGWIVGPTFGHEEEERTDASSQDLTRPGSDHDVVQATQTSLQRPGRLP